MTYGVERKLLQMAIILGCCVPILAGGAGAIMGSHMLTESFDPTLDNHFRYLSGLLLAIGLVFLSAVPRIETQTARVRLLTLLVLIGGLARLFGMVTADGTTLPSLLALGMELVITPLLCLWQTRIARRSLLG